MTEVWQWFVVIGSGIVFAVLVLDAIIRTYKYFKKGKKHAEGHLENKVKDVISKDRAVNCPWIQGAKQNTENRHIELQLLKDAIIGELTPMKKDIQDIKDITLKLHHSQMNDLQIKLNHLYNNKFDVKGTLSKAEQTNWDKWFSDYSALGGNSDIKRMDELIQAARVAVTLEKANQTKKEEN